ncbi:MAG: hypothetical protein ABGZ35_00330 [Planctomycetaceae bacterium]|jgi:hypothetical protein
MFAAADETKEAIAAGRTRIVAPLTKNSVFGRSGEGVRIQEITDGTSNTIMVLQTSPENAVVWTRPADLTLHEDSPAFQQLAGDADRFLACWCDGSARSLSEDVSEQTIRAILSMDGGEVFELP